MRHFLIQYRPPRDTFLQDSTPEEDAAIGRHFEYLQRLEKDGVLFTAGRVDDARFGIAVIRAPDESAAKAIMDQDPAVVAGVFSGELMPFRVALPASESETDD